MTIRLGLDARTLVQPHPRGTGRNLLDAYRLIPRLRPDWQFILYHQRPLAAGAGPDNPPWDLPNVTLRQLDMPGDRFDAWFQFRLPWASRRDHVTLMHYPASAAPAFSPVPFVLTVHDLIPLRLPDELNAIQTRNFRRGLVRGIRAATHIIAPSQATSEDIQAEFGTPADKITVIPWAPDTRILDEAAGAIEPANLERIRAIYRLADRWLLTFSGSTRRKNARGVLDGFARVAPDIRRRVQLVLVGCEPESYRTQLQAEADRLGISDQCRVLGFVPHEDLPGLFRGAAGLLMPSRCEGFGLPILDAFTCGVPVLTSNISSMPEVAGDAAAYCDPNDSFSIAHGITEILDPSRSKELIRRGYERVSHYTWQRTAAAMTSVFENHLTSAQPTASPAAARHQECA